MVAMKTNILLCALSVTLVALGCKVIVAPNISIPAATQSAANIERSATGEAPEPKPGQMGSSALEQAIINRRYRTAEIQGLKNNRIIGENHRGYLSIIELPQGEYGQYVQRLVTTENADRRTIYADQAAQLNLALELIESSSAKVIYDRSFRGEWVEEQQDGKWVWRQKTGDRTETAVAE
jgi:uncharacterized protein YdbL (DUF1318 family)